ncbi:unnamed protein product [Dovyalis caffra]|uniref:Uncharacterized protein n=1 Tax=Dovyalis caffra TaxID=77055 RepID=A0AAV1SHF4_9ROSI|nr:unnamed protein product [Dovyalis caffra]
MVGYTVCAAFTIQKRRGEFSFSRKQFLEDKMDEEGGEEQTVPPLTPPTAADETQAAEPQSQPDPPPPFDPSRNQHSLVFSLLNLDRSSMVAACNALSCVLWLHIYHLVELQNNIGFIFSPQVSPIFNGYDISIEQDKNGRRKLSTRCCSGEEDKSRV